MFLTLPTRADWPGDHSVGRVGDRQRLEIGLAGRFFAKPYWPPSGAKKTGIRLCRSAHNPVGVVARIAKLRTRSPAGERQVSYDPASAMSRPPLKPIA